MRRLGIGSRNGYQGDGAELAVADPVVEYLAADGYSAAANVPNTRAGLQLVAGGAGQVADLEG